MILLVKSTSESSYASAKTVVENNDLNGFAPVIGINNADGANSDSIQHAYANGYLTQEQATQATELAELWMRAPAQIGQQLPGPLSLGMAALSMVVIIKYRLQHKVQ